MSELALQNTVGAFDPRNEQILRYLGLDPRDPKSSAVVAVARRYDLDPVLKHVIVIPKAVNTAHLTENLDSLKLKLTQEQLAELDLAFPPPKGPSSLEML